MAAQFSGASVGSASRSSSDCFKKIRPMEVPMVLMSKEKAAQVLAKLNISPEDQKKWSEPEPRAGRGDLPAL